MTCPNCGAPVAENRRFCGKCGAALAPSAPDPSAPSPPTAWGSPGPYAAPPPGPPPAPDPDPYAPPDLTAPPTYAAPPPYPPGDGPPPYPAYPPPGPWGGGYPPAPPHPNGLAIASLVLGLVGWIPCGVGSVVAIVLGFVGRDQIDRSWGSQTGKGMATAGIILGFVGAAFWLVMIIIVVVDSAGSTG